MNITVKKYEESDFIQWEEFVDKSNNGTLFHLRKFINYHPSNKFIDNNLLFYKKNKIISVLPAVKKNKELISHPGTSIGSFIILSDLSFADALEVVNQFVLYIRKNKFDRIQITQPPSIYNYKYSNYIDFALLQNGFKYFKREITSILFLESDNERNLQKFKPSHRTAVRKAQKSGLIIKQSNNYEQFYSILQKNLITRHGAKPTHTLDEIIKLNKLFPDRINLFCAYYNQKMIAGVINFITNNNVILAFYISHDKKYQHLRPINLLFYKIFKWAIDKNFKIFDFGIFTVDEKPNLGLARFKENFGASGQFRDTYELIIND